MVAYNFQKRFKGPVKRREKNQTVRPERKRHARVGEPVQLYYGMRTKQCEKLVTPDPVCKWVAPCVITRSLVRVAGLPIFEVDQFARDDGFVDFSDMISWLENQHGLPFTGVLIVWE